MNAPALNSGTPLDRARIDRQSPGPEPVDTNLYVFEPLSFLPVLSERFPWLEQLFKRVGIHPTQPENPVNPYTGQQEAEGFTNIGEHCLAVAYCAEKVGLALLSAGIIDNDTLDLIIQRSLVHDLSKPYEIMRRKACEAGLTSDVYSVAAYEKLAPLLEELGVPKSLAEYLTNAGSETGHNSLAGFLRCDKKEITGLVADRLPDKVIHLADDMTWTGNPRTGRPTSAFFTCWERMLVSGFPEKYPFLWKEGLVLTASGEIQPTSDINKIPKGQHLLGHYTHIQVLVANLICQELQQLLDPGSDEKPEFFVKRLVRS